MFRLLVVAFFSLLALGSLFELRARLSFDSAKGVAKELRDLESGVSFAFGSEVETGPQVRSASALQGEALLQANKAAQSKFSPYTANFAYSSLLRRRAMLEKDSSQRLKYFCAALSEMGKALRKQPAHARLLVGWANLKQTLGTFKCEEQFTEGDYEAALAMADSVDPSDTQAKYLAGMILHWDGKKESAYKKFRNTLLYSTSLPVNQRDLIFQQIESAEAMKAIVPARFPQIREFSEYLKSEASKGKEQGQLKELMQVLAELQIEALVESAQSYNLEALPYQVHLQRLLSLLDVVAAEKVRKQIDSELADLYLLKREKTISKYCLQRSELSELALIPAAITADSRPEKTPLLAWAKDSIVHFDNFYQSIGFYLAEGQSVRTIELLAKDNTQGPANLPLRLLVSEDNQTYEPFEQETKQFSFKRGDALVFAIEIPLSSHPYWKINFGSSSRDKRIVNSLSQMLKVYGTSIRAEN